MHISNSVKYIFFFLSLFNGLTKKKYNNGLQGLLCAILF